MEKLTGGCLCGEVRFEVLDNFQQFHLCHCAQCRRITGSAHASNLFTSAGNLSFVTGEDRITHYVDAARDFSKSFCQCCGSGLPHTSPSSGNWVVPAGSLDTSPSLQPQDNIFWADRAEWYEAGIKAQRCEGFPD